MSWAEVKKVNSDLAEPLDEKLANVESGLKNQFGLTLIKKGNGGVTIEGINGILLVSNQATSYEIIVRIDDSENCYVKTTNCIPLDSSYTYEVKKSNHGAVYYAVYTLGGGIS